jgi:hypothetical protein
LPTLNVTIKLDVKVVETPLSPGLGAIIAHKTRRVMDLDAGDTKTKYKPLPRISRERENDRERHTYTHNSIIIKADTETVNKILFSICICHGEFSQMGNFITF